MGPDVSQVCNVLTPRAIIYDSVRLDMQRHVYWVSPQSVIVLTFQLQGSCLGAQQTTTCDSLIVWREGSSYEEAHFPLFK